MVTGTLIITYGRRLAIPAIPLTRQHLFIFDDQNDQVQILTPNLLIFGRQLHQENWLDTDNYSDPDYTLVSQADFGEAFKKLRASMEDIENNFYSLYLDLVHERDAKQMESKSNRKQNVVRKMPEKGDVVLLHDTKNKPYKVSRIIDLSKKDGSEIRSVKILLKNSAHWWPVSKVSFFEVGSPESLPAKFDVNRKMSDKNIVFPREKLNRLAKKNVKYSE